MKCYCGSQLEFFICCRPFTTTEQIPKTAEQLMRSRYSAFCEGHADYLVKTHWPVDEDSRATIQNTINNTRWIGLIVRDTRQGGSSDSEGWVEFIAFYDENGIQQLHEKSHFKKIDGRWYYCNGEHLPPVKLSRNDPCFCGSGKKYKKCHSGS